MRTFVVAMAALTAMLASAPASAEINQTGNLTDKPFSVGLGIGTQVGEASAFWSTASFLMELSFEYTLKVGPGELAPHFGLTIAPSPVPGIAVGFGGFGVTAGGGTAVTIGLVAGARYKIRVIKQPLYVWPFLDIGPTFNELSGHNTTGGILQVGAGISYLIHPMFEIWARPIGLGATFGSGYSAFAYTFLVGTSFRF